MPCPSYSQMLIKRLTAVFILTLILAFSLNSFLVDAAPAERISSISSMVLNQDIDAELARTQILSGVVKLTNSGTSGALVVYGDTAYVIADVPGKDHYSPMIAAAGWGNGRVLVMGHTGWVSMDNGHLEDNGRFYTNSLTWLANSADKGIKIMVTAGSSSQTWLTNQGYTNVVKIDGNQPYATQLADADLLVGSLGTTVPQADLDDIAAFVTNGGGLFTAEPGWIYGTYFQDIPEAPLNLLLRDAGIGISNDFDYYSGTTEPTRAVSQTTGADIVDMLTHSISYTEQEKVTGLELSLIHI